METIQNLNVTELSHKEMCEINGGANSSDRSLGMFIIRGLWSFIKSSNTSADETLMNCI